MNKLAEKLRERLHVEGLSVRDAAQKIGVSHATVARAANGETVEVDTLVKIASFLGLPVESMLDVKETPDEVLEQIVMVLSIEPELSRIFGEIARKVSAKEMDPKVLSEIAAFSAYRLQQYQEVEAPVRQVEHV
jgi:transcriptional regulator with XRE-family HTH domain